MSRRINKEIMQQVMIALLDALKDEDDLSAKELIDGLNEKEQGYILSGLSTKQRDSLYTLLGNK